MVCGGRAVAVAAMKQCVELVCCDGACAAVCSVIKVSPAYGRGTPGDAGKLAKLLRCIGLPARCLFGSRLYIIPGASHYRVLKISFAAGQFLSTKLFKTKVQRCGTTVISRRAAMRSSKGGWVLNSDDSVSEPNIGLTIQSAAVVGDTAVVGIRLL